MLRALSVHYGIYIHYFHSLPHTIHSIQSTNQLASVWYGMEWGEIDCRLFIEANGKVVRLLVLVVIVVTPTLKLYRMEIHTHTHTHGCICMYNALNMTYDGQSLNSEHSTRSPIGRWEDSNSTRPRKNMSQFNRTQCGLMWCGMECRMWCNVSMLM
jgi:hypothetical protein